MYNSDDIDARQNVSQYLSRYAELPGRLTFHDVFPSVWGSPEWEEANPILSSIVNGQGSANV